MYGYFSRCHQRSACISRGTRRVATWGNPLSPRNKENGHIELNGSKERTWRCQPQPSASRSKCILSPDGAAGKADLSLVIDGYHIRIRVSELTHTWQEVKAEDERKWSHGCAQQSLWLCLGDGFSRGGSRQVEIDGESEGKSLIGNYC